MASLNGIKITGLKTFEGREGMGYQGNITMDGKKIGRVFDEARGGEVDVDIEASHKSEFERRMKSYFESYPSEYPVMDIFLEELVNLIETEKLYKKHEKKGMKILADLYKAPKSQTLIDGRYLNSPETMVFANEKTLERIIAEKGYKDQVVYRSAEDFIISTLK